MPANGRWDLIQCLKGQVYIFLGLKNNRLLKIKHLFGPSVSISL